MKLRGVFLALLAFLPSALSADLFDGPAGQSLSAFDAFYRDARTSYVVNNLLLVGDGSVRMNGSYSAGFSYADPALQRDDGQTSQITLLGRNGGLIHDPYVRILVQTLENDNQYWGWQFSEIDAGIYSRLTWYRGAPAIAGATNIDISNHNLDPDADLILRSVVAYPNSTTATITAYAGTSEETLVELSSITVTQGAGTATDPTVPWLTGRYPGVLFYSNDGGDTSRPLFRAFENGVTDPNTPPVVLLTSPIAGTEFGAGEAIPMSATASDPDGSVTLVEFYDGSTKIGEDNTSPYTLLWNGSNGGDHQLSARAIDNQGRATLSSVVAVSVADVIDPVITGIPNQIIVAPDSGGSTARVWWTPPVATDNVSVDSFNGSHAPGDVFSPGSTTVTYTAIDAAGNTTVAEFEVTVTGIEIWRLEKFGPDASNPSIAGDLANPDGDTWLNLAEFALGLDPQANDGNSALSVQLTESGIEIEMLYHPLLPDVALSILAGSSPDEMVPLATRTLADGWTLTDSEFEITSEQAGLLERARLTLEGVFDRQFFRIKVERIESGPNTGLLTNLLWHYELNDQANGPRNESLGKDSFQDINGNVGTAAGLFVTEAADFSGAGGSNDDYLEIASQPGFQLGPEDSFSFCGWLNPSDLSNWSNICWNGSESSDNSNFGIRIHDSSRYWAMQIGTQRFTPGNQVAEEDTWQFVVWYFDNANNQVGISVNGAPFATTNSSAQPGPGGFLRLGKGAFWHQNIYDFEGRMQGLGFWKNRILTSDDVAVLYQSGAGLPFSQW